MNLKLLDTTLRDGEQAPGVAFTRAEKLALAKEIDSLGADIIEAGIPAMGPDEIECLRAMNGMGLKAELLCWCRMKREDIVAAACTGIRNVHIAVPSSPLHMKAKLGMEKREVLGCMAHTVEYAQNLGLSVSIGAEDASRAGIEFVTMLFMEAEKLGAVRVRYADTLGTLDPFTAREAMERVREHVTVDVDFHGHNDYGMATANALGAFRGGANVISCSVNGLGERAGNTPLEEIALALERMDGIRIRIDKKRIQEVSDSVERCSGKQVVACKPIVGQDIFAHESGIHVDGLMKCRQIYESLQPEELGRSAQIVLGKFSGRKAVTYKMREAGYAIDMRTAEMIIQNLRRQCFRTKFTPGDFLKLSIEILQKLPSC